MLSKVSNMTSITPVLLAGGAGKRLWPLSRKSYPKQFSGIFGAESLFQSAALRLSSSKELDFNPPITLTTIDFRFIVAEQLRGVGITPGEILVEPEAKNTAPAILAASLVSVQQDENAILLVMPSDHLIPDIDAFYEAVNVGLPYVLSDKIITFGIEPTRAETGYGYLQLERASNGGAVSVSNFVEKPGQEKAVSMLEAGNYLWNAGIFLFKARTIINSFEMHAPDLIEPVTASVNQALPELGVARLDAKAWRRCESISFDYAILEKVDELFAVPFASKWSDVGSWDAVWSEMYPDLNGVALSENATAFECENTLLRSESQQQEIVGIGLTNIIAVATPDAVLVANKDKAQEVKNVVEKLKLKGVQQAEIFSKDHRPWGWFESLVLSKGYQVKRLCVYPSGALSLQSHKHRAEHWIVVEGEAKVTVGDDVRILSEGQSVYVPLGAIHRLENIGSKLMFLVEVQIGSYLGEDDITRYEDIYSRE